MPSTLGDREFASAAIDFNLENVSYTNLYWPIFNLTRTPLFYERGFDSTKLVQIVHFS